MMYDALTGLSIFSEILISLCSLWSFKSVDSSAGKEKHNVVMEMFQLTVLLFIEPSNDTWI